MISYLSLTLSPILSLILLINLYPILSLNSFLTLYPTLSTIYHQPYQDLIPHLTYILIRNLYLKLFRILSQTLSITIHYQSIIQSNYPIINPIINPIIQSIINPIINPLPIHYPSPSIIITIHLQTLSITIHHYPS